MNHTEKVENYAEKVDVITEMVKAEIKRAKLKFPENFVNQHEGYAVLLEEVDELWVEIKKNQSKYDLLKQKKESIQVAAMAIRIAVELLYDAN